MRSGTDSKWYEYFNYFKPFTSEGEASLFQAYSMGIGTQYIVSKM